MLQRLAVCESSDWFWWLGDYNSPQSVACFDKLFRDNIEVRELIKLKAVYEHLESISDRCEDVANIIEGIVLENS